MKKERDFTRDARGRFRRPETKPKPAARGRPPATTGKAGARGRKVDISCGAVVYVDREDTRLYLLVFHAKGAHWGFPKGHPLPGEETKAAILRETLEETGCEIELLAGHEDSISYTLPSGGAKQVRFRLARLKKRGRVPLPNKEIRGVGWFTFEEARRIITYDSSRGVLARARAFLRRRGVEPA